MVVRRGSEGRSLERERQREHARERAELEFSEGEVAALSDSRRRPRRNYLTARDTTSKFSHWRFLVFFLASGGKELFFLCFFAAFPVRESSGGSTHTPNPHTLSSKRDRSGAGQAKRLRELVLFLAENYLDLFFLLPQLAPALHSPSPLSR